MVIFDFASDVPYMITESEENEELFNGPSISYEGEVGAWLDSLVGVGTWVATMEG